MSDNSKTVVNLTVEYFKEDLIDKVQYCGICLEDKNVVAGETNDFLCSACKYFICFECTFDYIEANRDKEELLCPHCRHKFTGILTEENGNSFWNLEEISNAMQIYDKGHERDHDESELDDEVFSDIGSSSDDSDDEEDGISEDDLLRRLEVSNSFFPYDGRTRSSIILSHLHLSNAQHVLKIVQDIHSVETSDLDPEQIEFSEMGRLSYAEVLQRAGQNLDRARSIMETNTSFPTNGNLTLADI